MKVKLEIDESAVAAHLNEHYRLNIGRLEFLPVGDSAYSYTASCSDGRRYHLKLFDHRNGRQEEGVRRLPFYLPLTWHLYHDEIFRHLTYPIQAVNGGFSTRLQDTTLVLFSHIGGGTLADAYPFSDEILSSIAESTAVLHQTGIPPAAGLQLERESYDLSFIPDLLRCLNHSRLPSQLRDLLAPQTEELKELAGKLQEERQARLSGEPRETVLCHGDIWGGNLILNGEGLYFLDWESALLAPRERDLFGFLGEGFKVFMYHYQQKFGQTVKLDIDLLRFYAYRRHLRNLTNWMLNILCRNTEAAQTANDLDMIEHHCLDRLGGIENACLDAY